MRGHRFIESVAVGALCLVVCLFVFVWFADQSGASVRCSTAKQFTGVSLVVSGTSCSTGRSVMQYVSWHPPGQTFRLGGRTWRCSKGVPTCRSGKAAVKIRT